MAITQNPLIGRARNSIGSSIMSKWRRFNTIRSKPITYSDNPSDSVTFNRNAMIVLNTIANSNRVFINLSLSSLSRSNNSFNTFFSRNRLLIDTHLMKVNENFIHNFLFSYGKIPYFSFVHTSMPSASELKFYTYRSDSLLYLYPDLLTNLIIFDHYDNSFEVIFDAFSYSNNYFSIMKSKPYPAYYFLFLCDYSKKIYSTSHYLGLIL